MGCFYNYKGIKFNSELELDDFLIGEKGLKKNDVVYSILRSQNATLSELNRLSEKQKEIEYNIGKGDPELGDKIKIESNKTGVTKFLGALKTVDSEGNEKRLFPEFILENYWKEMYSRWKAKVFTTSEVKLIFSDGSEPVALTDELCNKWRDVIEEKWKQLGEIGTALHRVLRLYFSGDKGGMRTTHNKDIATSELYEKFKKYFLQDIDKGIINLKKIEETLEYAKKLDEKLLEQFPGCKYYPEFVVEGEAKALDGSAVNLKGMVDLLVVDNRGGVQIIDYKTSPNDYSKIGDIDDPNPENGYSSAKVLAFKYQLMTYKRLLTTMGIYTGSTKLYVAPIRLLDFRKEGDVWTYDGIKAYDGFIDDLTADPKEVSNIVEKILDIFYLGTPTNLSADDLHKDLDAFTKIAFPLTKTSKVDDLKEIEKIVEAYNHGEAADNGEYYYKPSLDSKMEFHSKSLSELVKLVNDYFKKYKESAQVRVDEFTRIYNDSRRVTEYEGANGNTRLLIDIDYTTNFSSNRDYTEEGTNPEYVNSLLKRYLNPTWDLMQGDPAEELYKELGILRFKNNVTRQIDFVALTTNSPQRRVQILKGRNYITGAFDRSDVDAKVRDELVLDSTYGNIDLMKTMFVINKLPEVFKEGEDVNGTLGRVFVINPSINKGITAPNELLINNFNYLMKKSGKNFEESNYFASNNKGTQIKVATSLDFCRNRIAEVIAFANESGRGANNKWLQMERAVSQLDDIGINKEELRALLLLIKEYMETVPEFAGLKSDVKAQSSLESPYVEVYNYLLMAINECDGFHFKQQYITHNKWLEGSLAKIPTKGYTSLYGDNPGTTASDLLNDSTRMVTRAYQNIREDMLSVAGTMRKLVQDYKNEINFGYFKERTYGNMASIYKNFYIRKGDDLYFRNPDSSEVNELGPAAIKLLRFSIELVNKNRYRKLTSELLLHKKLNNPESYYKVPLMIGSLQSLISTKGLLETIKYKLNRLLPKNVVADFKDKVEGIVDPNENRKRQKSLDLWNMTNIFEVGDGENTTDRRELIKYYSKLDSRSVSPEKRVDEGLKNIERNIETLVLSHSFAYSQARHINDIMPNLKSIMVYLQMSELTSNMTGLLKSDIDYLSDFIKNKVLHRSLLPESMRVYEIYSLKLMGAASKMALAFNPAMLYQGIEGLFKNISLALRKPDGTDAFTFKNLSDSMVYTYKDIGHYGNGRTKTELLNELYSFNDMDMNSYVSRILSDTTGMWHFWGNVAFRMSSRPDYYNRMSIFGALMRADGCWQAHSVKDGKLVYDWTKDSRFKDFALGRTSSPEYAKLKAVYYATAKLLIEEGALNADGTKFKLSGDDNKPTPIPKAYTSDLIEGYKSLSNTLYGYYTHENRSLVLSVGFGAMWLLMYTYISGKKNQFLMPSRITLLKYLVLQKDENGKNLYYKLDSDGKPTEELTTEETPLPCMVWKGRFGEGIIVTLMKALKIATVDSKWDIKKGILNVKGEMFGADVDENIKTCYKANLQLLLYDISIFATFGALLAGSLNNWVIDYYKKNKSEDIESGIEESLTKVGTKILQNSTRDFAFWDALFGKTVDWNPFAINMMTSTVKNVSRAFTGDDTLTRSLLQSVSSTRQWKPVWNTVIPKPEKDEE